MRCRTSCFFQIVWPQKLRKKPVFWVVRRDHNCVFFSLFLLDFVKKHGCVNPSFFQKNRHFPDLRTAIVPSEYLVILGQSPFKGFFFKKSSKGRIFLQKSPFFGGHFSLRNWPRDFFTKCGLFEGGIEVGIS